jgi:transcriptional regulator with XRE-family HTH domain
MIFGTPMRPSTQPQASACKSSALRRLRIERGQSQTQLAAAVGILPVEVLLYESGRRRPDMETLRLLLAALEVSSEDSDATSGPWGVVDLDIKITVTLAG